MLVVDRSGWLRANADGFAKLLSPVVDKLIEKKGPPSAFAEAVGTRVTGAEVGLMLGFLSSKVLGQFDPFHEPYGRLLLVAPNIVHVEREIGADPTDFRLWVCLHEETHRVQFTANPWLGEHLMTQMHAVADTLEPSAVLDGLRRGADVLRGGNGSIIDLVSSPEQKEILDRVTGVMSLLEGHADVVMDGVGPTVIPSVAEIRQKFNQRRKGVGTLDKLLRRLLGLDAKMAQYRDGAVFVRHVVDKVGMEEFNAVWTGPETLPSKAEIERPRRLGRPRAVTLHPSVAAVRVPVRRTLFRLEARDGGRRSSPWRAAAVRTRSPSPPRPSSRATSSACASSA